MGRASPNIAGSTAVHRLQQGGGTQYIPTPSKPMGTDIDLELQNKVMELHCAKGMDGVCDFLRTAIAAKLGCDHRSPHRSPTPTPTHLISHSHIQAGWGRRRPARGQALRAPRNVQGCAPALQLSEQRRVLPVRGREWGRKRVPDVVGRVPCARCCWPRSHVRR